MKKNYVEVINNILFEADIEDIIFSDYQLDEYESESRAIANQITENMNVKELALVMRDVFDEYFLPNHNVTQFINIAEEILKEIF